MESELGISSKTIEKHRQHLTKTFTSTTSHVFTRVAIAKRITKGIVQSTVTRTL